MVLSCLCAVHCLATVVVVAALGVGGSFLLNPAIHRVGLALEMLIACVAIGLGAIRRVICASPGYLAEHGVPRVPRDLARHRCITFEGMGNPRNWVLWADKVPVPVTVHSRLVVNTIDASIEAAMLGVGLTRALSYQVKDALESGKLDLVLEGFEPPPWPVSLMHAGQAPLPLKLRAFLDFATPRLRERVAQTVAGGKP